MPSHIEDLTNEFSNSPWTRQIWVDGPLESLLESHRATASSSWDVKHYTGTVRHRDKCVIAVAPKDLATEYFSPEEAPELTLNTPVRQRAVRPRSLCSCKAACFQPVSEHK